MSSRGFWAFAVSSTVAVAAGCQSYDFDPVEPSAFSQKTQSRPVYGRPFKPSLMFLIDKSGSMNFPSNAAAAGCPAGCGVSTGPCPASCPTRISELRSAMNTFLTGSGAGVAWTGMAIFPTKVSADACGPTVAGDVVVQLAQKKTDLDADLKAASMTVNTQIQSLVPGGGTPTADSLRFLASYPPLVDNPEGRAQFVLLLTDGLPNCNDANANSCANPTACQCTLAGSCGSPGAQFCTKGCLDQAGTVAEITNLRAKNIKTIVVGFGADTASGTAPAVLNAMAIAGGFALTCPLGTNAECGASGANLCTNKTCAQKFFQAKNSSDLAAALDSIARAIAPADICRYTLEAAPSNPQFLSVLIDGAPAPKDQWTYDGTHVFFTGAICDRLKASTNLSPVKVEFRIVDSL